MDNKNLYSERSTTMVFGCLMLKPNLLEDIDKPLCREDFSYDSFIELLYSAIFNLYAQGCEVIDEISIDTYLSNFPEQYRIFQEYNGVNYLSNAKQIAELGNYDFYYHMVRKMSLLRYYEQKGYETCNIFNSNITEPIAQEEEKKKLESYTEQNIVDMINNDLVIIPSMKYCTNTLTTDVQAGEGLEDLIENLMKTPDIGLPLKSEVLNTVCRGARLGCLYMRSCPPANGKSRLAAADACGIAVPYYYDKVKQNWIYTGISEPTLYITTEMQPDEIQTIFVATISAVNEEHILYGKYEKGELERVKQAIQYIHSSPLYVCHIPDFSIEDIKSIVRKYNRERAVNYFFFDYIQTSLRLMSEVGSKSKMSGLKEHQLLLAFATELKTICQKYNVFMMTASQLNGEASVATVKDQNLLAGSKALANKLDIGCIGIKPNPTEIKKIEPIAHKIMGALIPNYSTWVYKVRRGKLCSIVIWSYIDFGTMRIKDLFVTNNNLEVIDVDINKPEHIEQVIEEHSVNMADVPDVPITEEMEKDSIASVSLPKIEEKIVLDMDNF